VKKKVAKKKRSSQKTRAKAKKKKRKRKSPPRTKVFPSLYLPFSAHIQYSSQLTFFTTSSSLQAKKDSP
jgi:hypothetical protein